MARAKKVAEALVLEIPATEEFLAFMRSTQPVADPMQSVRSERNQRLSASDWTQLADAPVDQAAWAEYRQALRDLPATIENPAKFKWPKEPK